MAPTLSTEPVLGARGALCRENWFARGAKNLTVNEIEETINRVLKIASQRQQVLV